MPLVCTYTSYKIITIIIITYGDEYFKDIDSHRIRFCICDLILENPPHMHLPGFREIQI